MKRDLLTRLLALKSDGVSVAVVTDLGTGLQALVTADTVHGAFGLDEPRLHQVRDRLRRDESGTLGDEEDGERLFVQTHTPPLRLIIIGAVHIAQALAPMAALVGYGVTVVDPRRAFATDARFPGIMVNGDWPDEALAALGPDSRTAIVTLTHDPKLDDPALLIALRSPAFYVGSLGSRKTHAKRLDRLRAEGLTETELARIHGPVGLGIGAVTPAEIAVSILAQITAIRRGGAI